MNARILWSGAGPDGAHDSAAILWDYRHSQEVPIDALNAVLAKFYSQNLHPFLYLAWNRDGSPAGLLLTEAMDGLEDNEIQALFETVVADGDNQGGDFSATTIPV